MPIEAAANLDVDRLGRVVANLLAVETVVVPAHDAHIGLGEGRIAAHFLEHIPAVDLHPDVIARSLELGEIKYDFWIDAQIELNLVANRDVLHILLS